MGQIVDKDDPTNGGRVRVRAFDLHPDDPFSAANDKEDLDYVEDQDLPWAFCVNGAYGKMNMVPDEGDWVFGFFADGKDCQHPFILGTILGSNLFDNNVPFISSNLADQERRARNPSTILNTSVSPGYPDDMPQSQIEAIIRKESELRGIDPEIAVLIFRSEGAGAYQSQISRSGSGSLGGKEASFGPYQLFTGGGLGNDYEQQTGRSLISDNTREGITNQIRFALDQAAVKGWQPWYGRQSVNVGVRDGLENAKPIGNWN